MNPRIRRALVSVSDKEGLLPLVQGLRAFGVEILSTGGTAQWLCQHKIPVREVADLTGFPEILGGRVKTLHPKVHGGILADRSNPEHQKQIGRLGLKLIDLVVVNLYPFEAAAARRKIPLQELIEQIDIGGVALLRSAAKNFRSVGVVCRPDQYPAVLETIRKNRGALPEEFRRRLAVEAFAETSYTDHVITQALGHRMRQASGETQWRKRLVLGATRRQILRYGENPHQPGVWYEWPSAAGNGNGWGRVRQLHGKELSFNNLLDMDAAAQLAAAFRKPSAVVVKHNNPCGVASAPDLRTAFRRAFACDPISAFGGIVGLNRTVDLAAAKAVHGSGFLECVVAPDYQPDALRFLQQKKNLRILEMPNLPDLLKKRCVEIKPITGGLLVQKTDVFQVPPSRWKSATAVRPSPAQMKDLVFAWTVARFVRSNAIVLVKDERTVGIGGGQASRVDSVRIALKKAGRQARGAILASDGFFPKPDGPQAAVRAGIKAIVQPGGSVQDPQVIRVAQKARIPMLLTGERHFRH